MARRKDSDYIEPRTIMPDTYLCEVHGKMDLVSMVLAEKGKGS